ncbi:MAG: hypothetical protein QGG36_25145 [Pirellulaceae bacterium]|nr:hypothetical protein [Pirellulaceae bacterium]MDP7019108.1 hypothetical protein [Pirellulaceae bacterium]
MKWNILLGTMVLGLGLCTQSFGFELLDRMLGVSGCGCESKAKGNCCESKKGGCNRGCDRGKSCGADKGGKGDSCCDRKGLRGRCNSCDAKAGKGDDCGADKGKGDSCCGRKSRSRCNKCTDKGKGDGCGADKGKGDGCGADKGKGNCSRTSLLERIFACNRCGCDDKGGKGGCGSEKSCGADKGGKAEDMAPMPPAPVVDPSAYLPGRRVTPVSAQLSR